MAGNTSADAVSLIYARVPKVTITSLANLSYLNLTPTTVTGTVDDSDATVTINSLPAPVTGGGSTRAKRKSKRSSRVTRRRSRRRTRPR